MYTFEELENYDIKQLKALADYDGISYSKYARRTQMIDLLIQLPLPEIEREPVKSEEDSQPCSVRIQRIRDNN